jgi:two-component system, OmpR family, phosphate regulon sensor histidine kinase PhoR
MKRALSATIAAASGAAALAWIAGAGQDAVAAAAGGAAIATFLAGWLALSGETYRNRAETRARQDARQVDLRVLAAVSEPCLVVDQRGIVNFANDAALFAFAGIGTGVNIRQWFRASPIMDALLKAETDGKADATHVERRPLERSFRVHVARIAESDALYLCLFSDQTEALRVDRMRADFIANASHELRTPLTAVMGFLETIDGPARNDPQNRDRFIKLMIGQTQRMARLIDDLLSLSRLESQSAPARTETIDLGLIAAACADAMSGMAKAEGIEIDNRAPRGELMVEGDRDELTQVVQNLLENAIKYGGGTVILEARRNRRDEIGLSVQDFGPGISSEHIPRLTERFYRVDVEASRQQKGTGLGLAIVKHILGRHKARLVIESALGRGSTFTILFPIPALGTQEEK